MGWDGMRCSVVGESNLVVTWVTYCLGRGVRRSSDGICDVVGVSRIEASYSRSSRILARLGKESMAAASYPAFVWCEWTIKLS